MIGKTRDEVDKRRIVRRKYLMMVVQLKGDLADKTPCGSENTVWRSSLSLRTTRIISMIAQLRKMTNKASPIKRINLKSK